MSTDPDYDDIWNTLDILVLNKVGIPFEKVTITLGRAFLPRNWHFDYENLKVNETSSNSLDYWPQTRQIGLYRTHGSEIETVIEAGSGRVGEIADGSDDPNGVETYEEYLERTGDGQKRSVRNKHWQVPLPKCDEN